MNSTPSRNDDDKAAAPSCFVTEEEAARRVAFAKAGARLRETSFLLTQDSKVRSTLGMLGLALMLTGTAVYAWSTIRRDVSDHARTLDAHALQLKSLDEQARENHDVLTEIRADLRATMRALDVQRE
jgi:hypothetical protein